LPYPAGCRPARRTLAHQIAPPRPARATTEAAVIRTASGSMLSPGAEVPSLGAEVTRNTGPPISEPPHDSQNTKVPYSPSGSSGTRKREITIPLASALMLPMASTRYRARIRTKPRASQEPALYALARDPGTQPPAVCETAESLLASPRAGWRERRAIVSPGSSRRPAAEPRPGLLGAPFYVPALERPRIQRCPETGQR
jgi:hypothetical protein